VTASFTNVLTASAAVPGFPDIVTLTNGPLNLLIEPGEYPGGNDEPAPDGSFNRVGAPVSLQTGDTVVYRAGIVLTTLAAATAALILRQKHA